MVLLVSEELRLLELEPNAEGEGRAEGNLLMIGLRKGENRLKDK